MANVKYLDVTIQGIERSVEKLNWKAIELERQATILGRIKSQWKK